MASERSDGRLPELRRDHPSGRWVLIAPDRALRPSDYPAGNGAGPDLSPKGCPFCEGRERETPPEVAALREPSSPADSSGWRVRVVPNKFPALIRPVEPSVRPSGETPEGSHPGYGIHEVVIDSPDHFREWTDLPEDHLRDILAIYRDRLRAIEREAEVRYVQIFKNKGAAAGASLRHPHTQILAVPVVPDEIRREVDSLESLGRSSGACYACRLIADEESGPRLVRSDPGFIAVTPFASRFPYEIHILPRRHASLYREIGDPELLFLAGMMKAVFTRLKAVAGDPAFHLVLRQGPSRESSPFVHWRLEVLPVLGAVAGFEWGTGFFINPVIPETAAARLRG